MKFKIYRAIRDLINIILLSFLILFERKDRGRRRDVLYFGVPMISMKYIIRAIRPICDSATSFVKYVYHINVESDFDFVTKDPVTFIRQLRRHNVYLNFYDSIDELFGPVSKYMFFLYKRLKKKKLVVMPYGSDAFLYSKIGDLHWRHALNVEYFKAGINEEYLEKRYFLINRNADFRVPCITHHITLSTWDILPVHYYPMDMEKASGITNPKYETFTVVHAPNHRGAKGTEFLIAAVSELKAEGHKLDLKILENMKNEDVLIELSKSHLLVEQLLIGYAMSAMEAMALGLPVIANLSHEHYQLLRTYSYLKDCPIISTELDIGRIKESIAYAMKNYEDLSKQSLRYMEKYHSFASCQIMWNRIFESMDTGERLINYFHPLIGQYYKDYESYKRGGG